MSDINGALAEINKEIQFIRKDGEVNAGAKSFKFRGIDKVYGAIGPLFKKHNIITTRRILSFKKEDFVSSKGASQVHVTLHVEYSFLHLPSKTSVKTEGIGEGMDALDKAINCAISNSYKYVIFEMFNLPSDEQMDSDQMDNIRELREAAGTDATMGKIIQEIGRITNFKTESKKDLFQKLNTDLDSVKMLPIEQKVALLQHLKTL